MPVVDSSSSASGGSSSERRITLPANPPYGMALRDGVRGGSRHVTDLHHCNLIVRSRFSPIRFARPSKIEIAASLTVWRNRESRMRAPPYQENGLRVRSVGQSSVPRSGSDQVFEFETGGM